MDLRVTTTTPPTGAGAAAGAFRVPERLARGVAAIAVLLACATPALAVSTRDLVELAKAGLSDDVLVALIEADGTIFNLDAPKILELRAQGISEHVITAMLRSGRGEAAMNAGVPAATDPVAPGAGTPDPYFVVIGEKPASPPRDRRSVIVVPWLLYGAGPGHPHPRPHSSAAPAQGYRGFGRFMNDGWVDRSTPVAPRR
jgi:hypothetical protein